MRMPDFFSRVHASGVTETLAAPLLLIGLLLQMEWSLDSVKVIMILILVLATNPTATHAMAKATLHGGQRPLVFEPRVELAGIGADPIVQGRSLARVLRGGHEEVDRAAVAFDSGPNRAMIRRGDQKLIQLVSSKDVRPRTDAELYSLVLDPDER